MKILQKVLVILLIAMCVTIIMPQVAVNADVDVDTTLSSINPEDPSTTGTSQMTTVIGKLLGFLQVASGLIAVIMIAATGFRYIIETPDMKKELKSSMIPIIVGVLLVFFAVSIARFFIGIFSSSSAG